MASGTAPDRGGWQALPLQVAADGSDHHPHRRALDRADADPRDLGDAVHLLCALHGQHPSVVDHAARVMAGRPGGDWLAGAAHAFAAERAYLARLTAAVGPLPSTPGQAQSEATVAAQAHALGLLAQSTRLGSALGTAAALLLDWAAIRQLLDTVAHRQSVEPPAASLPAPDRIEAELRRATAAGPGVDRALSFGAQQLLLQHRGLWDLLEARASARRAV